MVSEGEQSKKEIEMEEQPEAIESKKYRLDRQTLIEIFELEGFIYTIMTTWSDGGGIATVVLDKSVA